MGGAAPVTTGRPPPHPPGEPLLEVTGLSAVGDRGLTAVDAVDLTVRAGEIVGIAGVSGNGQRELCQVITGLRPSTGGRVSLAGVDLTRASPRTRFRAGLGYIPEDRLGVGLAPRLSVVDNAMLRTYAEHRRGPLLVADRAAAHCAELVERFSVRTGSLDDPIAGLSGGNLQRLLVGRELSEHPRVVVAGDTGVPYLSSSEETPATKAFNVVVEAVEQRLPAKGVSLAAAGGLGMADSGGCGCGSGGCDPNKCDC